MTGQKRRSARSIGAREANAIAANLGRDLRGTRIRRRLTQAKLGDKVSLSQAEISALEAGLGGRTSIETWVAIGIALDRPIAIGFGRDVVDPLPNGTGHLAAQELALRLATNGGWRGRFEASSRPFDPTYSTDVRLERDGGPVVLIEIWNRLDDLGAAARSSDRKLADVARSAGAAVASCWLLVDTAANRAIVRRYPAIFRARFGGSSAHWIRVITSGAPCPLQPGIAWIDVRSGKLRELRLGAT
jgi:transcriptional regulator with XRE-family HTH domain